MTLRARLAGISRELKLFAAASLMAGMAYSLIDSIFNNYLNDRFALNGFQRSFLEIPREMPGFLVVFVSALLWFLCSRRLGVAAMLMGVAGALLIGFASPVYEVMVLWLFLYSLGSHLFMPVSATIGMELAREGQTGRRLGQLNALRNLATIAGSLLVFVGFRYLHITFQHAFALAAAGLALAAGLMFAMKREKVTKPKVFLKLHKEYRLYYLLAVLFGSRKQIFITFAPWVIVTVFRQPTETIATLITIGGVIGILFQPLLGWMVDHLGERFVLSSESFLLVFVCLVYGFARFLVPEGTAFILTSAGYLVDQMLMSVSMARSTYIKKIARVPADIQPALSTGITIDHLFSILIALLGGAIWNAFGYQYVFLMGVLIAAINFFAAMQIRIPRAAVEAAASPAAEKDFLPYS